MFNNLTFLFIGRLLYDKGIIEFVEAAQKISIYCPTLKFQVIGGLDTQNPSAISEEQLRRWQESGIIDYQGETTDVRPYIAQADVIVLPSYREGLPRVMLEGMSMAKPLITTDVAGCRETVIDGENGFLVPAKDSNALGEAIKKTALLSKEERQEMGALGRKMAVEKFDEKRIIETYRMVIQDSLKKRIIPQKNSFFRLPELSGMFKLPSFQN